MRGLRAVAATVLLPTCIFTAVGSGLAADFAVSQAPSAQSSPAGAADTLDGRFLVTWTDDRSKGSGLDIFGRILDARAAAVSPDFAVANARRSQAFAAVAFDPTRRRFLVVWTDWRDARTVDSDIYGRFVSVEGRPEGAAFPIAQKRVSQKFPAVAFDPATKRFLVVWTERGGGADRVRGRWLAADGGVEGPAFALSERGGDQLRPSVVFDSRRNRFFVVWWDADESTISAAFVNAKGTKITPPTVLADDQDPQPAPLHAAAYSEEEDVFLVAWTVKHVPSGEGPNIEAVLLDGATASPRGPVLSVASGGASQQAATVAYDPSGRRFLLVWHERRRNQRGAGMSIRGRFVSTGGELTDPFSVSDAEIDGSRRFPVPAYGPGGDSFLILWEDSRGGDRRARRIFGAVR